MGHILRLTIQFLNNIMKWRVNIRKVSILFLVLIALYIFVVFNKNSNLRQAEYAENLLKKNTSFASLVSYERALIKNVPYIENTERIQRKNTSFDVHKERHKVEINEFERLFGPSHHKLTNQIAARVLLMYDQTCVKTAKKLKVVLDALRVPVDVYKYRENKTVVLSVKKDDGQIDGKYSLLLIVDHVSFFNRWPITIRNHFTIYTKQFNITTLYFTSENNQPPHHMLHYNSITALPINKTNIIQVHISAPFNLHFSKNDISLPSHLLYHNWHAFRPIRSPEVHHYINTLRSHTNCSESRVTGHPCSLVLNESETTGSQKFEEICIVEYKNFEGVPVKAPCIFVDRQGPVKIFVGSPINFWLTKILLMDFLKTFSAVNLLRFDHRRWVLIDIDDIFVAPEGLKMNKEDVKVLVSTQNRLRTLVPGLTFNLGYCGWFYNKGTAAEIEGSQELVRQADRFQWFGHIYNHQQPHLLSNDQLPQLMEQNKQFAYNHSIPVTSSYSVSPHHSGVYPVYWPLYEAWRRVWNITMTTTEEYPHLYPDHMRRGYIHRGIMVLPRHTCRLFTHTISYGTFPGGKGSLQYTATGGSVFNTLLLNPISIFMTHVSNYATDRLALQLFTKLFEFTLKWTNLRLMTDQPLNLGKRYFEIFPEDKQPIWGSPCADKRLRDIYPLKWNCTRLPAALVLGPQKTGTTALYSFLNEHPLITSNEVTKDHYEEVQFFSNDTLYNYGVEWYMDQFQYPMSNSQLLFEKSATYFTHPLAPKRVKALLPDVKLIVILTDPVKRAYSWYQHMIAHKDKTALKYSFSEVIRSNMTTNKGLQSLRNHCLSPGQYHKHLQAWLEHFHAYQILLIDGGVLVDKPTILMFTVQQFLDVEEVNYGEILRWNARKGFYCLKSHCLGASKGRHYDQMSDSDVQYLEEYYHHDNKQLAQSIRRYWKSNLPEWLRTQVYR